MKKKWLDFIFVGIFMAMLFVPLLLLDTTPDLVSEQENRAMTKWPGLGFNKEINEWYGHYFEDRIGFREQAVRAYTKLTYGVFGEFSEDLHMFGKDGYVFPADEGYVQAYQRLRTDEALIQDFTTYLKNTKEYLQEKEIPFVFVAGLDKKTVYPEYINMIKQTPVCKELFSAEEKTADSEAPIFVPDRETVIKSLAEKIFLSVLYKRVLETALGAQASTLTAMRSAYDTACEYSAKLETEMNRKRQSQVTADVIEISSEFSMKGDI